MTKITICAGCGRQILWRFTPDGARMPLDPEPRPLAERGTYVLRNATHCRPSEPMFDPPGTEHHMNHWSSCPNADEFKRETPRKKRPSQ